MDITWIDYVGDLSINEGDIFNGLRIRLADSSILCDFAGMNPEAAYRLGFPDIQEDEMLIDPNYLNKETVNHEANEYRIFQENPDVEYWPVHYSLQRLSKVEANMNTLVKKIFYTKAEDAGERTLVFTASGEDEDRVGDSINQDKWELVNYKKNPVFMFAHDYSKPPIGRCVDIWVQKDNKGSSLKIKVLFADEKTYPFADTIYRLYKGGFMNAVSVGFRPTTEPKYIENAGVRFEGQELLEVSAVPVPCYPDALIDAGKRGIPVTAEVSKLFSGIIVNGIHKNTFKQTELKDELDFVLSILKENTLNEENLKILDEICRTSGYVKPVKNMSNANRALIKESMDRCVDAMKGMDEHHRAHNSCYKSGKEYIQKCYENLQGLAGEDKPEEDKPEDKPKSILDTIQSVPNTLITRLIK